MPKLIGIKELQTNTRTIREQVGKGVHFVVIYRSKPVFEICPLSGEEDWTPEDRYTLLNETLKTWSNPQDDDLFDDSVTL